MTTIEKNLSDFALLGIHFYKGNFVLHETYAVDSSDITLYADKYLCVILETPFRKKIPLCNLQEQNAVEIFLNSLKKYKIEFRELRVPQ